MSAAPLKAEVGVAPEESGGNGANGNPYTIKTIDHR
jgi:hypothetical protein